jgi:tRNA(Ile)-lysidine synthase
MLVVSAPASHIAAACLCAAGTSRPPRGDRLVARLRSGEAFTSTLAGARIESDGARAVFMRDAGRAGLPTITVEPGRPAVWDGRFEIGADTPVIVRPLAGLLKHLPKAEQAALRDIPAAARPTLPAIIAEHGPTCPILADGPSVRVRTLAVTRFEAAAGFVDSEPDV